MKTKQLAMELCRRLVALGWESNGNRLRSEITWMLSKVSSDELSKVDSGDRPKSHDNDSLGHDSAAKAITHTMPCTACENGPCADSADYGPWCPVYKAEEDTAIEPRAALWLAIDRYVVACGGDPTKGIYGNTPRQDAVAEIERRLAQL